MVDLLRKRSLVDEVFVSTISNANEPMEKRDLRKNQIIKTMKDIAGDTQGKRNCYKQKRDYSMIFIFIIDLLQYIRVQENMSSCNRLCWSID